MVNQVRTKDIKVKIVGQDLLTADLKKIRTQANLTFKGMVREATKSAASVKKIRTQAVGATNNLKTIRSQANLTFRGMAREATKSAASVKKIHTQALGAKNNLKTLRTQSTATFKSVQKQASNAADSLKKVKTQSDDAFGAMRKGSTSAIGRSGLGGLGLLGIAYASTQVLGEVRQMADAWTNANNRIKLFTDSAAEQVKVQRDLFKVAQDTRGAFDGTVQIYQRLQQGNDKLKLSQERLLNVTRSINQAIQVSGVGSESANAAIVQLGQGLAAGALRGQELNSVMEQTPRLARAIATGMGVGIGELRGLAEQGKITAEVVIEALESQATALDKEFAQLKPTIDASFGVLGNSLTRAIGQFDKATGASDGLGASIRAIGETIDRIDWARAGGFLADRTTLTQEQIAAYDPRSRRAGLRGYDEPGGFGSSAGAFVGPLQSQGGAPDRDRTLENSARAWADAVNKRFTDAKFSEQFFKDFSDSVRQDRDAGSGRFRAGIGEGGQGLPTLANLGLSLRPESEDISFEGRTYKDDVRDQKPCSIQKTENATKWRVFSARRGCRRGAWSRGSRNRR